MWFKNELWVVGLNCKLRIAWTTRGQTVLGVFVGGGGEMMVLLKLDISEKKVNSVSRGLSLSL